jgi:hypothetical protein
MKSRIRQLEKQTKSIPKLFAFMKGMERVVGLSTIYASKSNRNYEEEEYFKMEEYRNTGGCLPRVVEAQNEDSGSFVGNSIYMDPI